MEDLMFLIGIYITGIISFFSPCIFPIIPVYISILSAEKEKFILRTVYFLMGLSLTFFSLIFSTTIIVDLIFNDKIRIISGIIIFILGMFQIGIIKIRTLEKTKKINLNLEKINNVAVFFLGATFVLGWSPCIGPTLATIILLAGNSGEIITGFIMMAIYLVGFFTPFILISLFSKKLIEKIKFLQSYLEILKKIGGIMLIIFSLLLITDKINILIFN